MLPGNLLTELVTIKRRNSQGRDSLNNPIYGQPTSGAGWYTVIANLPVRLAFSGKGVNFSPEGERITPNGIMYFNTQVVLLPEDRVLTSTGIEYNVINVSTAYLMGSVVDHFEAKLQLP